MDLVFLQAAQPLTKTIAKLPDGTIEKSPYPNAYEFTSHTETVSDLAEFHTALVQHAKQGRCLLKGLTNRALVSESRAGSTDSNQSTQWICLDIDNLPNCKTIDDFLSSVGLGTVSYIVQHSASAGIASNSLNAHVFMLLDKPMPAPLLKQWLIDLNHKTPMLSSAMHLTKTDMSIHWPLDVTVCQNDKLIYIAPPILKKIKDPFAKTGRIQLITKAQASLSIADTIPNVTVNQKRTNDRINALREAKGLPARRYTTRIKDGVDYVINPDVPAAFDTKVERGFVYFNLNGGDSWGYFHPENNPKYIHNFKGEPTYLTEQLLPDYWRQLQQDSKAKEREEIDKKLAFDTPIDGIIRLAFCDRVSSVYYRGTYEPGTNRLDISATKSSKIIETYMRMHGMTDDRQPDIPEWDLTFDPHDSVRVDPVNKTINLFQPTPYMLGRQVANAKIPKIINRVIKNVLNDDGDIYNHFINWLAFIVQERSCTGTAWVLHGTTGTGKGLLLNKILRPLLGENQVVQRTMEALNEHYNEYMRQAFIVFIDEIESGAFANSKAVQAKLKNFISEPMVALRIMHRDRTQIHNYTNWIFASNRPDPVKIDREDRRYNVARYQPNKLVITDAEIAAIGDELQTFYSFLMAYPVDRDAVRTPIDTDERNAMIDVSQSAMTTACNAVLDGDFGFFIDQLPDSNYTGSVMEMTRRMNYEERLKQIIERTARDTGRCNVSRDDLHVLFSYVVGDMPEGAGTFTLKLKHHGIRIGDNKRVRIGERTFSGTQTTWKDVKYFDAYLTRLNPPTPAAVSKPPRLKVIKA